MTATAETVAGWFRGLRWYLREAAGESAYERYVERERHLHPVPPCSTARVRAGVRSRGQPTPATLLLMPRVAKRG